MIRPAAWMALAVVSNLWLFGVGSARGNDAVEVWGGKDSASPRARFEKDPTDIEAAALLAYRLVEAGDLQGLREATKLLEDLVEADPENARLYFFLGRAYGRMARHLGIGGLDTARRSKKALLTAVGLEPHSFEYAYALNEFFLKAPSIAGGSRAQARERAEAFEQVESDGGALLQARIDIVEGNFKQAWERLRGVSGGEDDLFNQTRRELMLAAGFRILDSGDLDEASVLFSKFVAEFPNDAAGRQGLGLAKLRSGAAIHAVRELQRSLEQRDAVEVWYALGMAYEISGDAKAAADCYRAVLARASSGTEADEARRRLEVVGE